VRIENTVKTTNAYFQTARAILLGVILLIPLRSNAKESTEKLFSIALMAPLGKQDPYDALFENAVAQLEGLPVTVRMVRDASFSLGETAIKAEASSILFQDEARIVFWCDLTIGRQVNFLVRTEDGNRLSVRELRGSGPEGIADAVVLIARTTVETLLDTGFPAEEAPPLKSHENLQTKDTVVPNTAPNQKTEFDPPRFFRLAIRIAYVPQWISFEPIVIHGGRVEFQFVLRDLVRINLGASLSTPIEQSSAEIRLTETKIPFHIGAVALAKVGQWRFGGGVNALFSLVKTEQQSLSDDVIAYDAKRAFAFSVEFPLEMIFHPIDKMELFLGGAIEIITDKTAYRVESGDTLLNDAMRVQPKIFFGLALFPI
jgi:hypothetical protein